MTDLEEEAGLEEVEVDVEVPEEVDVEEKEEIVVAEEVDVVAEEEREEVIVAVVEE